LLGELVDFKLRHLILEINEIHGKWEYHDSVKFLVDARNGTLHEAEMDAIILHQLLADRDRLDQLKAGWQVL
jgi:hypothetical protein